MARVGGGLLKGRRVLVVEDEPLIALDLQTQLEELGACVVGPIPRVSPALEIVGADERIDAATLDVNVAEDLSFPLAEKLLARRIPFVFVTAYSRLMLPERFRRIPCYVKPVDARDIAAAVGPPSEKRFAGPPPGS